MNHKCEHCGRELEDGTLHRCGASMPCSVDALPQGALVVKLIEAASKRDCVACIFQRRDIEIIIESLTLNPGMEAQEMLAELKQLYHEVFE